MYKFLIIIVFVLFSCKPNQETMTVNEKYDAVKAEQFGADEYGMKKYVFAFLYRGPNRDRPNAEADELQRAHLENINRLAEDGKLVVAGPFFGNDDLRGIYIFNVESIKEAEELTNTDPAIQAGALRMELREWYGSAALLSINDIHKTLEKKKVAEK